MRNEVNFREYCKQFLGNQLKELKVMSDSTNKLLKIYMDSGNDKNFEMDDEILENLIFLKHLFNDIYDSVGKEVFGDERPITN